MKKNKWLALLVCICLVVSSIFTPLTAAETGAVDLTKNIRVGLKALYEMKPSLKAENSALQLGYEIENIWEKSWTFESSTGFVFSPAIGYIVSSITQWTDYTDCNEQKNMLREQGYEACVASVDYNVWTIAFTGFSDEASAAAFQNRLAGVSALTFEIKPDNGERTIMTYSDSDPLILENEVGHAQFAAGDLTNGTAVVDLGERSYRGRMEIGRFGKSGVTAINVLPLTEYLYGVVASEMPQAWPVEALKAQAVAARNFAVYNSQIMKKYPNEAYSICDTVNTEVYKGFTNEAARTNSAVDATKDIMVYYGGKVVPTFFFSGSGGHTENSENVWSGTLGYVKGKPDLFETEPVKTPWIQVISAEEVKAALARYSVDIGDITDVSVTGYTDSGRAMSLMLTGTTGNYELVKETMRVWLGLKSRKFTIVGPGVNTSQHVAVQAAVGQSTADLDQVYVLGANGEPMLLNKGDALSVFSSENINSLPRVDGTAGSFTFVGQGNGHGAGMSQSGAKGMALQGYGYQEILKYYFTDVVIK